MMFSCDDIVDALITLCPRSHIDQLGFHELTVDSEDDRRRVRFTLRSYGWSFTKLQRIDATQHEQVGFSGPMRFVHLMEICIWLDGQRDLDRVRRETSAQTEHAAAQCVEDLAAQIERHGKLPPDAADRPLSGILHSLRSLASDLRSGNYPPADQPAPGATSA